MLSSQSLNIASVSLTRTCLDTNLLATLIYACKGLKTLIYEIDSDTLNLVEPSELAAILNSQGRPLNLPLLILICGSGGCTGTTIRRLSPSPCLPTSST
jgi:hypothetical protein